MSTEPTTDVIFRKFRDGAIIALFPYEIFTMRGDVGSYMHVGQHSSAEYKFVVDMTKLATPDEYAALKSELEGLGYVLRVVKKQVYSKYLQAYHKAR